MKNNPLDLLESLVREACFTDVAAGDLRPWIRYVAASKPAASGDAS